MSIEVPLLIVSLLFSVIVHEVAHGVAALRLGDDTALRQGRLTLNPVRHIDPVGTILVPVVLALMPGGLLFGWARPVPVNPRRFHDPARGQALVAAAGPASNLLLALLCSILLGLAVGVAHLSGADHGGAFDFARLLLWSGIRINVLLALFNLIPIPPLDGSWVVLGFLRGEAAMQYERLRPFGFLLVLVLLYAGLGQVLGRGVGLVSDAYLGVAYRVGSIFF